MLLVSYVLVVALFAQVIIRVGLLSRKPGRGG